MQNIDLFCHLESCFSYALLRFIIQEITKQSLSLVTTLEKSANTIKPQDKAHTKLGLGAGV